jgi:hypothetical protein
MAGPTSCCSGHPALRPSGQPSAVQNRSRRFWTAAGLYGASRRTGAETAGAFDPVSRGTSLCRAPSGQPAAVQIGNPADLSRGVRPAQCAAGRDHPGRAGHKERREQAQPRRGRWSLTSVENAQRARRTGAPAAAAPSAFRMARIPPSRRHFPERNRLLHQSAGATAGRPLRAGRLHCRQPGPLMSYPQLTNFKYLVRGTGQVRPG